MEKVGADEIVERQGFSSLELNDLKSKLNKKSLHYLSTT